MGGGGKEDREEGLCPPPPPPRSLSCCCSSFSARVSGCRTHTPESHCRRWSTQVCLFALHTYAHTHFQPLRDESWLPPHHHHLSFSPGCSDSGWLRGAKRTDRAQYSKARGEQKEHCSNATMSSLAFGASEEAADALHSAQYQPESPRQLLYGAGPGSDMKSARFRLKNPFL